MTSSDLFKVLQDRWPQLRLITKVQMGNCKISDEQYDVLPKDTSISLLKKSFWQRMTEAPPAPDKNDCDNRALRAMMRANDRHTGGLQPAIGYLVGSFDGQAHAVNILICVDGIHLWDDWESSIVPLIVEPYFIWM